MSSSGLFAFRPLIFEKATPSSCERPVLRITTLGFIRLNALEKFASVDFRLVTTTSIPRCSICLRRLKVKVPFLLVESLQSMTTV